MNRSILILPLIAITLTIITLSGCKEEEKTRDYNPETEQRLISKIYQNPDSATEYIDDAVQSDSISHEHGDYLVAFYYYYILKDYKTTESILNGVLKLVEKNEPGNIEEGYLYGDILMLAARNFQQRGKYAYSMHYARKASAFLRTRGEDGPFLAADMDCMTGFIMAKMGKNEESLKIINDAIALTEKSNRFLAFHSKLNCLSKKVLIMHENESQDEVIEICDKTIKEIEKADKLKDIPLLNQDEREMDRFKDFYRGIFLSTKALELATLGRDDEAKAALCQCLETEWGKTHALNSNSLMITYAKLGMSKEVDACIDLFRKTYGNDTVNLRMASLLSGKAKVAYLDNDYDKAERYAERAGLLKKMVFDKEIAEQITLNAEMMELNEKEREKKEEAEQKRLMWTAHSIIWSLVVLALIHIYFHLRKNRRIKAAYLALIEKQEILDTNLKIITNAASTSDDKDTILFEKILQVMRTTKPYLKEEFTINTLAELLNTNVSYVSRAINSCSYKTFPQWLAEYRNQIAIRALQDNPNLSTNEVCLLTGHITRETFSRQFKSLNGLSFTEFKEQNKDNASKSDIQ